MTYFTLEESMDAFLHWACPICLVRNERRRVKGTNDSTGHWVGSICWRCGADEDYFDMEDLVMAKRAYKDEFQSSPTNQSS